MTDKLFCPFCQQKLDFDDLLGSCINEKCEESFDMVGTKMLWQKVIDLQDDLIDTKKKLDRYEKVLEKIAKDRKIISMIGYSFDNEIYINAAREALGLPLDIPEYDNID